MHVHLRFSSGRSVSIVSITFNELFFFLLDLTLLFTAILFEKLFFDGSLSSQSSPVVSANLSLFCSVIFDLQLKKISFT